LDARQAGVRLNPLSEVIEEFGRYNARPLFIDDPKLLGVHISGTFATTDSAQLAHFLAERFGLVIHDTMTYSPCP